MEGASGVISNAFNYYGKLNYRLKQAYQKPDDTTDDTTKTKPDQVTAL